MLLGVAERSGTNFLSDTLILHPELVRAQGVWEDAILMHLETLVGYTRKVASWWPNHWDPDGAYQKKLLDSLVSACESYLIDLGANPSQEDGSCVAKYVVTKTPSVRNLSRACNLSNTRVIVLVRDGRAVVESGMRSFGWSFTSATDRWARAVDEIEAARAGGTEFLLVRYEDLLSDPEDTLSKIFEYLDLPVSADVVEKMDSLPVRGSSSLRGSSEELSWKPLSKTESFDSLARFKTWGKYQHFKYALLASRQSGSLGYKLLPWDSYPIHWRLGASILKHVLKLFVRGKVLWRRLASAIGMRSGGRV